MNGEPIKMVTMEDVDKAICELGIIQHECLSLSDQLCKAFFGASLAEDKKEKTSAPTQGIIFRLDSQIAFLRSQATQTRANLIKIKSALLSSAPPPSGRPEGRI